MSQTLLDLDKVQFYWRMSNVPAGRGSAVPAFLPFAFAFEPTLQLVIQKRNSLVLDYLERVYREDANVGYLQEGHALATSYGGEFVGFIERAVASLPSMPRRAIEIGCGGVYLLRLLKEKGFDVLGIDPSPVTGRQAAALGIEIIPEFYPVSTCKVRADLIFHYDVLEHVAEPVKFLAAHRENLNPGGSIVIAVPDCTENIRRGDISMILHEHLNYFDEESLGRTVRAAGLQPARIERSTNGAVLYCLALPDSRADQSPFKFAEVGDDKFDRFRFHAESSIRNFGAYLDRVSRLGKNGLGVYVPLRSVPYLSTLGVSPVLRFFDDDPGIHSKYFDGFDIPVENFADLVERPVDHLLISSFSFDRAIEKKVRSHFGDRIEITSLRAFVAPE